MYIYNMKNIKRKREIDINTYVNTNTGETLISELKNNKSTLLVQDDTELYTIDSKEYVVIDSKALEYIISNLSYSDTTKTLSLTNTLKTEFNVIFNHTKPHNLDSLSELLGTNKDEITKFIKRLTKLGILAYVVSTKDGQYQKCYVMNPSLARKRKTFNKELLTFFDDLTLKK